MDPLLMGEFRPGYYIGNLQSLKELPKLGADTQWTVISILKSEKLLTFARTALKELATNGECTIRKHVEWELQDESQAYLLSPKLTQVLDAMDEASLSVVPVAASRNRACCLVHCAFGVSRSAAVCAAWLMARQGSSLQQAMAEIRLVRPDASPNMGFIASLRALEMCKGNVDAARERMRSKKVQHS